MNFFGRSDHPVLRLGGTVSRLPRYAQLARALVADSEVPPARKAVLGAAIAYTVSPIDLVPGIIPVAGQLDDLTVLLLGLRQALAACPREVALAHLTQAGLSESTLDDDLQRVQAAAGWLVGKAASWGMRAFSGSLRTLSGALRAARPKNGPGGPAAART
ncbi:MAG: YkvA family protein [Chloroflexota bacterium]